MGFLLAPILFVEHLGRAVECFRNGGDSKSPPETVPETPLSPELSGGALGTSGAEPPQEAEAVTQEVIAEGVAKLVAPIEPVAMKPKSRARAKPKGKEN